MHSRLCLSRTLLASATVFIALAAPVLANTWIVDVNNGAGANFTQLTDALIASQAGDVIIVRPGAYVPPVNGLAINKGVTIIGQGIVTMGPFGFGGIHVDGLPAGEVLLIVNLTAGGWQLSSSQGSVTIRECKAQYGGVLTVDSCSDVRIQSIVGIVRNAVVSSSRVEIADCTLYGTSGAAACCYGFPGGNGTSGLTVNAGSLVHLARSSAIGGNGGDTLGGPAQGGSAGAGVAVNNGELWIDGGGIASLQGGVGGVGDACPYDGACGPGLWNYNGTVVRSGANLLSRFPPPGQCGAPGAPIVLGGTAIDQVLTPDSPTLELIGNSQAGSQVTFTVHAPPGSAVRLNVGPTPQVLAAPGILVEALLIKSRSFDLGIVPPAGVVSKLISISPANLPGYRQFAQARVVLPGGEVRRSSSSLLVVR